MTEPTRLAELKTATETLAATTDFASTLRTALQLSAELTRANGALLVLFNKNTQQWFVHSRQGIEASDPGTEALQVAQSGEKAERAGALTLPLQVKGRIVGALEVRRDGFSDEDRLIFETFASSAALAIDSTLTKTDFVSTVTHELRLPMTSIKGYSDLIRGGMAGPVSDMQKQLLETVRVNVDWMNALVSDLGDIAKVETGRLKADLESLDVTACINEAVTAVQAQVDAKGQTVTVRADGLPKVLADRKRTVQMITYMLTNSTRYSPEKAQIDVKAEVTDGLVKVAVTDNGLGVAVADQPKLFTQFFRSEDPVVRDHKGWGLALSLVKQLAGLMGGSVGAESVGVPGQGSTFWFTIPVANGN